MSEVQAFRASPPWDADQFAEALRESAQRFQLMADSAPVMIWMSGSDKLRNWFNQPWLDFVGRSMEDDIGDGWIENVHPADRDRCLSAYIDAFDTRQPFSIEYRLRRYDGEYRCVLDNGVPLYMSADQFIGYIGSCIDISERKQSEQQLHTLQEELLQMSRRSTMGEMASALAHELNQPLTAIANYLKGARLLLQNSTDESAGTAMDAISKAAEQVVRAGQVIQRLRDFVTHGETERQIESIKKIIEEASTLALLVAKEQPIRLRFDFDPTVDLVLVDKIQIQQVLINLLRNSLEAMHSSDRREIAITTCRAEEHMVRINVCDSGPGIPPDIASRLFRPFVTTKQLGMGIGLSICRTIIDSHGGQIEASQNPEGGTIVRFTVRGVDPDELDAPTLLVDEHSQK